MPTYAYRCLDCQHQFETMQKITEEPLKECPKCHKQTLQRGPGGGIGLSFTGTGFYHTDYAHPAPPESKPEKPPSKGSCKNNGGSCGCH